MGNSMKVYAPCICGEIDDDDYNYVVSFPSESDVTSPESPSTGYENPAVLRAAMEILKKMKSSPNAPTWRKFRVTPVQVVDASNTTGNHQSSIKIPDLLSGRHETFSYVDQSTDNTVDVILENIPEPLTPKQPERNAKTIIDEIILCTKLIDECQRRHMEQLSSRKSCNLIEKSIDTR